MSKMKALLLSSLVLLFTSSASAATIIKFNLGGIGPDLAYQSGVLSTISDGNAATTGDQDTGLEFVGFLDGLFADIASGASLSIAGITANGLATVAGTLVTQATTGGTFSVYSPANVLLLSGNLADGAITGSTSATTGSYFNTTVATFTGGSLLAYVATTPAAFSLSFSNVGGRHGFGMLVTANGLQNFVADATGQIEGAPVPEPASAALLISGVLGGIAARRRKLS